MFHKNLVLLILFAFLLMACQSTEPIVPPLAVASPTPTLEPTVISEPTASSTELVCLSEGYCHDVLIDQIDRSLCEPFLVSEGKFTGWPSDLESPGKGWTWYPMSLTSTCEGIEVVPLGGGAGYSVYKIDGEYVKYQVTFPQGWRGYYPAQPPVP